MTHEPHILREVAEIPDALDRAALIQAAALLEMDLPRPRFLITVARGSSDHAATVVRYAFEIAMGLPALSLSPSLASVYRRRLDLSGALCLLVSQSGRSPDILAAAAMAREGGAFTLALVNDASSPLAAQADAVLPIAVGPERAVAATKSYIGAVVAGLRLVATLAKETDLTAGLDALPALLRSRLAGPDPDLTPLLCARSSLVLGRGAALGVAQEAALKLKELLRVPAEAFSSAEVAHGPWALTGPDCTVVGCATDCVAAEAHGRVLAACAAEGSPVVDLTPMLPGEGEAHDFVQPLLPLPALYRAMARTAAAQGLDPDAPPKLKKITRTV